VKQVVARAAGDSRLKPDAVRQQIEGEAVRGSTVARPTRSNAGLRASDGQVAVAGRHPDAGAWSRSVWEQARDLIAPAQPASRIAPTGAAGTAKILDEAIKRVAEMWATIRRTRSPRWKNCPATGSGDRHSVQEARGALFRVAETADAPRSHRSR